METKYCKGITIEGYTIEFEVEIVDGLERVYCVGNRLTYLELVDGIKEVYCEDNLLTSLKLVDGLEIVNCRNNRLTSLKLVEGIKIVECGYNQLTSLELVDGLEIVNCEYNNFVGDNYFTNPKTGRVVIYQNGKYSCGCFCGKTPQEFKIICEQKGFIEIINHFNL